MHGVTFNPSLGGNSRQARDAATTWRMRKLCVCVVCVSLCKNMHTELSASDQQDARKSGAVYSFRLLQADRYSVKIVPNVTFRPQWLVTCQGADKNFMP